MRSQEQRSSNSFVTMSVDMYLKLVLGSSVADETQSVHLFKAAEYVV